MLLWERLVYSSFFFQAEDGIRDTSVTGVQTCALPISFDGNSVPIHNEKTTKFSILPGQKIYFKNNNLIVEIGRASCRERV